MIHLRMQDPPEDIENEAAELHEMYYKSIPEDSYIDPDEKWAWIYAHASDKFKKYLDERKKLRREAEDAGEMI